MDAEAEMVNLTSPVSLPEVIKPSPEVINLMSTSSDSRPPEFTPNIFCISGLGGIPLASKAQDISRLSSISRQEKFIGI